MSSYRGWIGIDPGKDGAIARVWEDGRVRVIDVPVVTGQTASGKNRTDYDDAALAIALRELMEEDDPATVLCAIERVHAGVFAAKGKGVRIGVVSIFSFGMGFGLWRGVVAGVGAPLILPDPRTWKGEIMADGPKHKEAAIPVASRLYPRGAHLLRGPRGGLLIGRADAILLAHFSRLSGGLRES
jgi:hypothetical protein